jgi:5-methylcytosine-specific restriction endonuclease McrA
MLEKILYYYASRWLREMFNIRLAPRQAYQQDYLQSPRWLALRHFRRSMDGYRCQRCGAFRNLQTHHKSYKHRGQPGISGFVLELFDLQTLCGHCLGIVCIF